MGRSSAVICELLLAISFQVQKNIDQLLQLYRGVKQSTPGGLVYILRGKSLVSNFDQPDYYNVCRLT